ncbi:MAG TPA: efflux RND transporter periplasmic adaptor subunit [Opitutaceae bacterium]|nr:efflux RND transporter periplasmic adaptor subunit [Opitutaceae bacterium]
MKVLSSILFLCGLIFALAGCDRGKTEAMPADVDYYTCTMHPSVRSHKPHDKCPICSMDLVPVKKASASTATENASTSSAAPTQFTIPLDRQQLIGVTYATVERAPLQITLRALGTVAADKLRHWDYVSRVEGYVQQLSVGSRGEAVKRGDPLLTLYSPDLLATQRELIDAFRIRDEARKSGVEENIASAERLVSAARRRLSLWNLSDAQLAELEKTRQAVDTLTLSSPFDGVVLELMTNQGSRVMPGDHLVDIADLSVVWVWAEIYQEELPFVKTGQNVSITSSTYPGEKLSGKIALVDPFLDATKRTARVRIDVPNPELKLRPEMYVNVELTVDAGEGLVVPVGAVLPTGEHNVVFVDKGSGKLEPRFVELGRKFGERYAVEKGLAEGERVVSSANFLVDAEAKVQGALKPW